MPSIFRLFQTNFDFLNRLSHVSLISNLTDIHPVGGALVRVDGGTDTRMDMAKVIGAFGHYANGSEKDEDGE